MPVLVLNAGSSTLKFGVYLAGPDGIELLVSGQADVVDGGYGGFELRDASDALIQTEHAGEGEVGTGHEADVVLRIDRLLARHGAPPPRALGHRIVHGGAQCRDHVAVDDSVFEQLEAAIPFAPLHLPPALALLESARRHYPTLRHVACLDTAFHADMPAHACTLPIAKPWRDLGLRRYGFHGLSCESIVAQFGERLPARLVIAHLGGGSSITAVASGRSVDTTMGLTPSGGVMMGTRSGDLDPGVLVHVLRETGIDATRLDDMINHESGMHGVSGRSGDMRTLRCLADADADARLAIDMYCHSVRKHVAAMASVLGGVDRLVFTGGIGENDARTREAICDGLGGVGIGQATVLASDEGRVIARHAWRMVA